jgi:hypothetical protein
METCNVQFYYINMSIRYLNVQLFWNCTCKVVPRLHGTSPLFLVAVWLVADFGTSNGEAIAECNLV